MAVILHSMSTELRQILFDLCIYIYIIECIWYVIYEKIYLDSKTEKCL